MGVPTNLDEGLRTNLQAQMLADSTALPNHLWTREEVQVYADIRAADLAEMQDSKDIKPHMVTPLLACLVTPDYEPLPTTVTNLMKLVEMHIGNGEHDLAFLSIISRFHEHDQP